MSAISGRKLSLEGATLIGTGFFSEVYLFDEENVVKVLKGTDFEDADREIQLSKWALKKGIPTAISYDVVDVNGHPGLVYESLGRNNLRNVLRDTPEQLDSVLKRYLELLHTLGSVVVEPGQLPDAIDEYRTKLEELKGILTEAEYEKMSRLLDSIPKSQHLVHGDCHIKNIKVVRDELVLIDLDTLRCGDAIFELSPLLCTYNLYLHNRKDGIDTFFDIDADILRRLFDGILAGYFSGINEDAKRENRRKLELLSYMYMTHWYGAVFNTRPDLTEYMCNKFRELLAVTDDLILKHNS